MADPTDPRRCRAKARSGERCKKPPMKGQQVCRAHGGAAPQSRAAARQRLQQEAAQALLDEQVWSAVDVEPVTDTLTALQRFAGQVGHASEVLGAHVGKGHVMDQVQAAAWLKVLDLQRKVLTDMERLGIAQRAVELEAGKVRLVEAGISAVFEFLGIVGAQREQAERVLFTAMQAAATQPAQQQGSPSTPRQLEQGGTTP